jgi:alkylated DNA repair protein alkB family protein 7
VSIYPDLVSEDEHAVLCADADAALGAGRSERAHWDGVASGYRERAVQLDGGPLSFVSLARRVHALFPAGPASGIPKPSVHVLELEAPGRIDAHVDSVKFSGGIVAGVCLLSDAVMHLSSVAVPGASATLLLPARCAYVLTGAARFDFAHAIPCGAHVSTFRGRPVVRGRRVSLMFRDEIVGNRAAGPTILASGRLEDPEAG